MSRLSTVLPTGDWWSGPCYGQRSGIWISNPAGFSPLRNQLKWDEMDVHGEPQSQDVFLFPLLKTVLVDIPRGVRLRCTSVSGEPDSPPKTVLNSWQLQKGPSWVFRRAKPRCKPFSIFNDFNWFCMVLFLWLYYGKGCSFTPWGSHPSMLD